MGVLLFKVAISVTAAPRQRAVSASGLRSASDWEPPVLPAYPFCNAFVKIWLFVFAVRRLTILERRRTLMEKLSDLCRDQKQTITPRKTNQDIAESTDLSVGTVAQFFRGDIKNPSVYTAGPICREMGVSMDDYLIFRARRLRPIRTPFRPRRQSPH